MSSNKLLIVEVILVKILLVEILLVEILLVEVLLVEVLIVKALVFEVSRVLFSPRNFRSGRIIATYDYQLK